MLKAPAVGALETWKLKRFVLSTLIYLLLVPLVLAVWLYLIQPRMVFYPVQQLAGTPADWGMAYQDVWLTTDDGVRLHGWYLPRDGARQVVLFLHGNAGNISHRGESLAIFHRLGLNVFIVDYRGYGRSGGSPDEAGLYRDADAAWAHLVGQRGFAPRDVVLFGRSLGGTVAAQLAAKVEPGGLILESTFSSARAFANAVFPVLSRLMVLRYRFDTAAALTTVQCPVLVLHSPADEIMPYALGRALYEKANPPKAFVQLQGDHNSGFLRSQPRYQQALAAFVAGRLPAEQVGTSSP